MAEQAKLEDSNVANLGGKENKAAVKNVAASAEEWKGAGQSVGVEIWRIEKFKVVRWSKSNGTKKEKKQHGKFFTGDAYIVLNTYEDEKEICYDVHFWLGSASTQDERGTAAYKTVELDTLFDDKPVQYREIEAHESAKFLKLFNNNITYMQGGIDSAFHHVKPTEYVPRLFWCKGKKKIRVTQVPLELKSINNGDSFLVDNGLELIIWNGTASSPFERRKAQTLAQAIKDDRNGRPKVTVVDGQSEHETLWKLLGGNSPIAEDAPAEAEQKNMSDVLVRVTDQGGDRHVHADPVEFKRSNLDSGDVFICGHKKSLYVWVGSGASRAERKNAMRFAMSFITIQGLPQETHITRVIEGHETKSFNKIWGA